MKLLLRYLRVASLPLVIGFFAQWTTSSYVKKNNSNFKTPILTELHVFPSAKIIVSENELIFSPFLEKDLYGFKEALAFKESQGRYTVVNTFGYMGKYQFGKGTLALIGIKNTSHFLTNPVLQEKAFIANLSRNKWILRKDIKRSVGKYIKGILVTESGILASAHLSGPGSVKKFLRSNGEEKFADGYGTTIEHYMKKFSSYNVSEIKPNKRAKVKA